MKSTNSTLKSLSKSESAFSPMTEAQMETIKGGSAWPEWLNNLADNVSDQLVDQIEDIVESVTLQGGEDLWEVVHSDLYNNGFGLPDWDDLDTTPIGDF